jgi:hypothetical protein
MGVQNLNTTATIDGGCAEAYEHAV